MRENPYLENLSKAGARPEDVDYVFCTHLHSRSRRLEHAARQWPLGSDLSERQIFVLPRRRRCARPAPRAGERARHSFETRSWTACCRWSRRGSRRWSRASIEIGDGLTIVPAPGHSPGHSMLRAGGFRRQRPVHRRFDASSAADRRARMQQLRLRGRGARRAARGAAFWRNAASIIACSSPATSPRRTAGG